MKRGMQHHVPKTAGNATETTLRQAGIDVHNAGHGPARETRRRTIGQHVPPFYTEAFHYGFVRNPWDRIVSFFHHAKKDAVSTLEFTAWVIGSKKRLLHTSPIECFYDEGEYILDFVGQYEHLERDIHALCDAANWPHPEHIMIANPGKKRPAREWQSYYNEETRKFVAEIGRWEIERYGYTFEDQPSPPVPWQTSAWSDTDPTQ